MALARPISISDLSTITGLTNTNIASGAAIDAAKIANGSVSNAEFQRLDGVTSAVQTQIDGKAAAVHTHAESDVTGLVADLAAKMTKSANLSDITSAATARSNLGLGSAATTAASDYAAASHTHAESDVTGLVTDLAAKLTAVNNLNDLTDISAARNNLGLGTAATSDTSAFDSSGAASTVQNNLDSHESDGGAHGADSGPTNDTIARRNGFGDLYATNFHGGGGNLTGLTPAQVGAAAASHSHAESDVTGLVSDLAAKVPTSRTVSTTSPLSGGGALSGDLTLSISAASGSAAGSQSAAHFTLTNNATDANTASTIVKRDGSGNFSAGTITATFSGSGASITSLSAANISAGTLAVARGGTGTGTAFTAGSIVFAGASGVYSQDNSNFFWDDSNNRLGVGTTTPGADSGAALQINNSGVAVQAQFGDTLPFYLISNEPNLGMNLYYNGGWKYGSGSSAKFGAAISLATGTGDVVFYVTTTAGNSNGAASLAELMRLTGQGQLGLGLSPRAGVALDVGGPIAVKSYAVASLPTAGTAGRTAFASNGRKVGEGGGAGTGTLVYDDGTAWRRVGDDTTVLA